MVAARMTRNRPRKPAGESFAWTAVGQRARQTLQGTHLRVGVVVGSCRPVSQTDNARTLIDGVDVFVATGSNFGGCCLLIAD